MQPNLEVTDKQATAARKMAGAKLRSAGIANPKEFNPAGLGWQELNRAGADATRIARDIIGEIGDGTSESEAREREGAFDALMTVSEWVQMERDHRDQVGNRSARRGGEHPVDLPTRDMPMPGDREVPGDASAGLAVRTGGGDSEWRDKQNNPIAVLGKDQRVSDYLPANATRDGGGIGFGQMLRAIALGPRSDAEKRALGEGTPSSGGYTVPSPVASEFIDRLRANSSVMNAGARTVPMDSNTLQIARLDTDPSFSFKAENAQMSDNSPTMSAITFNAKTCVSLVRASQELLEDTVNANEILLNAFAQAGALTVDRVALVGSGSGQEPEGVLTRTAISELTALGAPDYDHWLDGMFELENADVPQPFATIAHPDSFKRLRKNKDNDGRYLTPPPALDEVAKFSSTQLPITSGSPDTVEALVGHFPHLFVGMRRELTIKTLDQRYADFHEVGFIAFLRFDIQLAHPESFVALRGLNAG